MLLFCDIMDCTTSLRFKAIAVAAHSYRKMQKFSVCSEFSENFEYSDYSDLVYGPALSNP